MNIFFTSDTHFFHSAIIKYCPDSRSQFNDAEEMNEFLVNQWNDKVNPNDTVYHLGDVGFARPEILSGVLRRLNGQIILVPGNHDHKLIKKHDFVYCFENIICSSYFELKIGDDFVTLCHYPIAHWNRMYYNQIHLYGHCHGSYAYHVNALDVGVDVKPNHDMAPWEWQEIKDYVANRDPANLLTRNVDVDSMLKPEM